MRFRLTIFGLEVFTLELVKSINAVLTVDSEETTTGVLGGHTHNFEMDSAPRYPEDRYAEHYIERPFGFSG